jgi:hypothetical protein
LAKDKHISKKTADNKKSSAKSYSLLILPVLLLTFLVYAKSIGYFITHLDDFILIFEKEQFNNISNIFKAFTVGTFGEKDIYYRPLLQITFMVEQLFKSDSLAIYHINNILLHLWATYLVYRFFVCLGRSNEISVTVALLFALHPALTMAVAWIPGRNDSLLTVFTLLFFIQLIKYTRNGTIKNYYLQLLFFTLALFTKETAFFIPIMAAALLYLSGSLPGKRQLLQLGGGWLAVCTVWFLLKMTVSDNSLFKDGITTQMNLILERMPRLLMYFGKVFFPVELSNYPSAENMSVWWGVAAVFMLTVLIAITQKRNLKMIAFGLAWFIIFIIPFFLVPKGINDQVFEHRMYLPIIGIFILLTETALLNGQWTHRYLKILLIPVLVFFIYQINQYLPRFQNQFTFWENAVKDSPNSSYANNILAARYISDGRKEEALPLFKKAYELNKAERYCRYFIARDYYMPMDSVDKAISLIKEEIEINHTYVEAYFELSHIYFLRNDLNEAVKYLEKCKELRPTDPMINNNLLLTYIKLREKSKAEQLSAYMLQQGLKVPEQAMKDIQALE